MRSCEAWHDVSLAVKVLGGGIFQREAVSLAANRLFGAAAFVVSAGPADGPWLRPGTRRPPRRDGRKPAAAGFPLSAAASPLGRHGTGHWASLGTQRQCGGCRGWFDLPSGALERSPRRQQGRLPRHSWGPGRSTFPFLHLFLRVHSSAVGARGVASGSLGRGRAALTGLRPPEG